MALNLFFMEGPMLSGPKAVDLLDKSMEDTMLTASENRFPVGSRILMAERVTADPNHDAKHESLYASSSEW